MWPYMLLQRLTCDSILAAEFVVESAESSGIRIDPMERSKKWFTMYMRPVGLAPAGRSRVHLNLVNGRPRSVKGKLTQGMWDQWYRRESRRNT